MVELYRFEKYGVSFIVTEEIMDGETFYILREYVDGELMSADKYQDKDRTLCIVKLRAAAMVGID